MLRLFNIKCYFQAFKELLTLLTRHRQLTIEMAKREITDRYLGQVFGIFWAIGHPLIMMVVYVFIFAYVFKVKIGGTLEFPFDYTTYLLAGLIPWFGFQEAMSKSSTVIVTNANLVKQVIFPIEVLPVKGVISALITQIIFLILLFIYVLAMHHFLLWTYVLLPVLILLQAMAMIGVAYTLAALGTYFRDIKDFVQVLCVVNFYLLPILYLPEFVPEIFRPILYVNPFSYLVWCYQDALYYGRFEHGWAWVIFFTLSAGIFLIGYRIFRKLKVMFGNVL